MLNECNGGQRFRLLRCTGMSSLRCVLTKKIAKQVTFLGHSLDKPSQPPFSHNKFPFIYLNCDVSLILNECNDGQRFLLLRCAELSCLRCVLTKKIAKQVTFHGHFLTESWLPLFPHSLLYFLLSTLFPASPLYSPDTIRDKGSLFFAVLGYHLYVVLLRKKKNESKLSHISKNSSSFIYLISGLILIVT